MPAHCSGTAWPAVPFYGLGFVPHSSCLAGAGGPTEIHCACRRRLRLRVPTALTVGATSKRCPPITAAIRDGVAPRLEMGGVHLTRVLVMGFMAGSGLTLWGPWGPWVRTGWGASPVWTAWPLPGSGPGPGCPPPLTRRKPHSLSEPGGGGSASATWDPGVSGAVLQVACSRLGHSVGDQPCRL